MTKVTALKAPTAGKNFGVFKVENFSMFEEDELAEYAALRNRAADASNGIKIEMMREYSRKTTKTEGELPALITTTTEEIILTVHYWEKPAARQRGESPDEAQRAQDDLVPGPGRLVTAQPLPASGTGRVPAGGS